MPGELRAAALELWAAGISALPAWGREKRPAIPAWKEYQTRLPELHEFNPWPGDALCIVTGAVSGNLELIDFDQAGELYPDWSELVEGRAPGLLDRLVMERSQRGGMHVVYRCETAVGGNAKLAQRRGGEGLITLIETRGEGGLFLCAPSPKYVLTQGKFAALPTITELQRLTLLDCACQLNEHVEPVGAACAAADGDRPGDDFNARGDVREILRRAGWTLVSPGANETWCRPGKPDGVSATLKRIGECDLFHVFSSNAAPFEPNRAYAPFGVYTLLEHAGDYSAAAAALGQAGFGKPPTPKTNRRHYGPAPRRDKAQPNRLEVLCMSDVQPEQHSYLWPGRLTRAAIAIIGGVQHSGKNLFFYDMIARVTTGRAWPDGAHAGSPANVILLESEEHLERDIRPRLEAAGSDLSRVKYLRGARIDEVSGRHQITIATDLRLIAETVEVVGDVAMVVISPITAYEGTDVDDRRNAEVRTALIEPLKDFAERYDLAVVLVRHPNKQTSNSDPLTRIAGSAAWTEAARTIMHVGIDPSAAPGEVKPLRAVHWEKAIGPRPTPLGWRVRLGPNGAPAVEWTGEAVNFTARQALAGYVGRGDRPTKKQAAADWLLEALEPGPAMVKDLVQRAREGPIEEKQFSLDALDRARTELRDLGKLCIQRKTGAGETEWWVWLADRAGPEWANSARCGVAELASPQTNSAQSLDREGVAELRT